MTAGPIVLFGSRRPLDQFAGVPQALRSRGIEVLSERLWGSEADRGLHAHPGVLGRAGLLAFADLSHRMDARPTWLAQHRGTPTVLLADGVVDFATTYLNPWMGRRFMRPAPQDVVLALGPLQVRLLEAMGNRVVRTGLPRLDGLRERVEAARPHTLNRWLLVATANTPALDAAARSRILSALAQLREEAARREIAVRWRLTGDLGERLGVRVDRAPLADALAGAWGVASTASTLVVEAMLAGVPTGVVHPHPWPLWVPAALQWTPRGDAAAEDDRIAQAIGRATAAVSAAESGIASALGNHDPCVGGADQMLDRLASFGPAEFAAQDRLFGLLHTRDAAKRVADALVDEHDCAQPYGRRAATEPERLGRTRIEVGPKRTRRLVVLLRCGGAEPTPEVRRAMRLAAMANDGGTAEVHVLLVPDRPGNFEVVHVPAVEDESCVHLHVPEPTLGTHERIEELLVAVSRLRPDVLAVNDKRDGCVAAILALRGVPAMAFAELDGVDDEQGVVRALDAAPRVRHDLYPDSCVRMPDDPRWPPRMPGDHAAADAWIAGRLREAGYERVALEGPEPGCDAVLVPALARRPDPEDVERWRASGLAVGVSPNLCVEAGVRRAECAIDRLVAMGCGRIAVAGTDRSSVFTGAVLRGEPIVGWIDAAADDHATHMGLPAAPPDRAMDRLRPDGAIALDAGVVRALPREIAVLPTIDASEADDQPIAATR
ncbi:MAG: hypothetical protein AAFX79_11020 [Planctomycetota bacterium]